MKLIAKLQEALADKAAEAVAASLTVVLAWAAYQMAPALLPALETAISKRVLLALLVASVLLNAVCVVLLWHTTKGESLRLKYGVYWDRHKNPHCPSCQKPLSAYDSYQFSGRGYYCKPCNKVFPLTDVHGKHYEPADVIKEL